MRVLDSDRDAVIASLRRTIRRNVEQDQNLAEIQDLINRFVSLFGFDNPGIVAMFTKDAVAVGTGADEVSFGLAEIRSEMGQDTSQIDDLSMTLNAASRISVVGEAGFVYSNVTFVG